MKPENEALNSRDLSPYAGRWVALISGRVAGVGRTAEEARHAAQAARPKEKPQLRFVTLNDWQDHPLLKRVWGFLKGKRAEALLVGGAVRDGLLGRALHDFDFVVNADALVLAAEASTYLHGVLVPLDLRRQIARVVVRYAGERFYVDFARRQGEDWVTDLRARDFTVNAIARDAAGVYLDPLNGREDLAARLLRATNEDAFRYDPLRTLRAVRLMAELDMTIEPLTAGWIQRDAPLLVRSAPERVRDEFVRILDAPGGASHLETLNGLGLLGPVIPEALATQGVTQPPPHTWDVWTHTLMTIAATEGLLKWLHGGAPTLNEVQVPAWVWGDLEKQLGSLRADLVSHLEEAVSDTRDRRFLLKLGVLFHDMGKPATRSVGDDGRIHFYGHERVSADMAVERMRALRFSLDEVRRVETIVAHHLRPGQLARGKGISRRAIYRYFRATGSAGVEIGLLSLCDILGGAGRALASPDWLLRLQVVATLLSAFFEDSETVAPAPLVNGHELMQALGLAPGPEVGRLLEAVREAQVMGEVQTREEALALAEKMKSA